MSYRQSDDDQDFTTLLWRFMQNYGSNPMTREELAVKLTRAGFTVKGTNVTQWLNGHRTPPPGLPYYSALALDLDSKDSQRLAWAFTRTYKDNRKNAGRSGKNEVPEKPGPTESQLSDVEKLRDSQDKSDSKKREGNSHRTGNQIP